MAHATHQTLTVEQPSIGSFAMPYRVWAGLRGRFIAFFNAERDSLALWLPVALGSGIVAWTALPSASAWGGYVAVMLGLAVIGWLFGGRHGLAARALMVGSLLSAAGCALIWWKAERVAAPVLARPAVVAFAAQVVSVEALPARENIRFVLRPLASAGLPPQVRVSVDDDRRGVRAIVAGDWVRLRARLMPPPRAALPGGYDFSRRAWFDRIGAVGTALGGIERVAVRGQAVGEAEPSIRARLSAHIQSRVEGGPGAIAAALATGDRGAISADDDEAMRRAGLAHLLSISGLHITAAVGGTMWLVLRLLALSPWLALRQPLTVVAAGAGAAVGLGYTLLTGAEIPTIRSLAAALLVLLALMIGREGITLRLVATGAMIVLLIWPEALAGPSFQLSFAAVTAIVAIHSHPGIAARLARRDEGWLYAAGRWLAGLLLTGLAVELALMPIALFHFHKAGLYGALANMIVIPLTTLVIMPAEALALALDLVGLGAPAWWVVEKALRFMLWIAHWVAGAPGSVAALPSMATGAFALMTAGGLWLALWQSRARRWGILPFAIGAIWAATTPAPDILITSDGRHVAVRGDDGRYLLLRDRAGEFVQGQLAEAAGIDGSLGTLSDAQGADCNADYCSWSMVRGGRRWQILAARSNYRSEWRSLVAACARADIVIADRWLPRGCNPRWIKADRKMLSETGGLSIVLDPPTVQASADDARGRPWSNPPTIIPPR
jgi:competence protein ComEC